MGRTGCRRRSHHRRRPHRGPAAPPRLAGRWSATSSSCSLAAPPARSRSSAPGPAPCACAADRLGLGARRNGTSQRDRIAALPPTGWRSSPALTNCGWPDVALMAQGGGSGFPGGGKSSARPAKQNPVARGKPGRARPFHRGAGRRPAPGNDPRAERSRRRLDARMAAAAADPPRDRRRARHRADPRRRGDRSLIARHGSREASRSASGWRRPGTRPRPPGHRSPGRSRLSRRDGAARRRASSAGRGASPKATARRRALASRKGGCVKVAVLCPYASRHDPPGLTS